MEPVRKIAHPRTVGPVDLQIILNPTVNMKVKLQHVQKIFDSMEECSRNQPYFENMVSVILKVLSTTDPAFTPENDVFKIRKLILQIIHKICSSSDKIKNHIQNTMIACLKVIETDNEQCVIYSILIFKELLNAFKPKFDGCFKNEVLRFLRLIMNMYSNSSTAEKIFNFQNTSDLKVLISTIRLTTTITKNSVNFIFVPMGKISFKVLKELAHILKMYYLLYYTVPSFKTEIIEFFPILLKFFNLDVQQYKPEYRDLILDLRHSQVRLLSFFSIFIKDNQDSIKSQNSTLSSRVIRLLNCSMASDVSSLRTELLSGFESVILTNFKSEFLPYMDKFLDETLVTGKSWSLKSVLRPKAYIYIDHLITHLHNQFSLNFLVRVIHSHFNNILDPTLQPEVQINLCNMIMVILNFVMHRENQSITNLNIVENNGNPLIDLIQRIIQIFVIKLKQFHKFYLPQMDKNGFYQENVPETISSILTEKQPKEKQRDYSLGYHSSKIVIFTVKDAQRLIRKIIPAINKLLNFMVKIEGGPLIIKNNYKKTINSYIKYSLLSLKLISCPIIKMELVNDFLLALSCITPTCLKITISGYFIVEQIYDNNLETLVFDIALKNEVLVTTFTYYMFEYILINITDKDQKECIFELIEKIQLHYKFNLNDNIASNYISKIIEKILSDIKNKECPLFYLGMLKMLFVIVGSEKYELTKNMKKALSRLFNDLFMYHQSLQKNLVLTKVAITELCLAHIVFRAVFQDRSMDYLLIVAYALEVSELTSQGLYIFEICLEFLPDSFFDEPTLQIRNDIMKALRDCLNSSKAPISESALRLLTKFGGLNRSSIVQSCRLNPEKQLFRDSREPNINVSFEGYENKILVLHIGSGMNSAVEALMTRTEPFYRVHSWNVIRGFLMISMECDTNGIINILSNINWTDDIKLFYNNSSPNYHNKLYEGYIKALTGLMICCGDEFLKEEAFSYMNEFIKRFVIVAICYHSGFQDKLSLRINPYVLIDAVILVLSNEKEIISKTGLLAIEIIMKESHSFLGNNMIRLPYITYMFSKFCKLCYDPCWVRKRGGCMGLKIFFSILLKNKTSKLAQSNQTFSWLRKNFFEAFNALLFIFCDFSEHLTFGAMDLAQNCLVDIINWISWIDTTDSIRDMMNKIILKKITSCITGPNDSLSKQCIRMIHLIARRQKKSVAEVLEPYFEHFKSAIPGEQLFNKYTFKSQIGIMRGHLFCAMFSIPAEVLDFSIKEHTYYFNILCVVCRGNYNEIKKIKMLKKLTSNQLFEFREVAMQVLVNCLTFLTQTKKKKVFKIVLKSLRSSDLKRQETAYQCLKSRHTKLFVPKSMIDRLLFYYAELFQNHAKVTMPNIRCVLYLSTLFPSSESTLLCTMLCDAFNYIWDDLHNHKKKKSKNGHEEILVNVLEILSLKTETEFGHIREICNIIFNKDDDLSFELRNRLYPLVTGCLMKYPEDCVALFFQEENIKNSVWYSFFHSMILNKNCQPLRSVMISDRSPIDALLLSARMDSSKTVQYQSIKIIYNLVRMERKWIINCKKLIIQLLSIWMNPQYKERYKNAVSIKFTEWDEPKMLLKILVIFFMDNNEEIQLLFQILPALSQRYPTDISFFRKVLDNEIVKSYSIEWKRKVFFKFLDSYQKKSMNGDILGKILQYLILPSFTWCYENGEKDKLLRGTENSSENIIDGVLNKVFNNFRVSLFGCDYDGIKLFLCQLICLLIEDLLSYKENICDLLYNGVISCTWIRCTMDTNVKYHCYLILTYIMLSDNTSKRDKLNQGIYYELLKASAVEAQPVINYALNLIVSAVKGKNKEVNTLVVCIKKIMMNESQNVPTLHHICSFLVKYNALFYPYKQFLIRNILGSLFPIAKNNNVPEFKNTAIELACMIIKWELSDSDANKAKLNFPSKRTVDDVYSTVEDEPSSPEKKSSETIDNCLNFLAMVGCQTHDDKDESRISLLAERSTLLFKTILNTEPIECQEVKLKFGWIDKLLDTFLKKENLIIDDPNAQGNTNASLMNLLTTFDLMSFMLNYLSQKLMLEAIKPLQDHLIKFLQLAFEKEITLSYYKNQKENLMNNRLNIDQIIKYHDGTLKIITEILKTFPSSDGLEKLHEYIKIVISEGLTTNESLHKLDVSLTLLKASRIHFRDYLEMDIINTLGKIMFKANEKNEEPKIKVKCLEILKTHVDCMLPFRKQIFIEKIVMENLNKALDSTNTIPIEVQIMCFDLIISYIRELSEATEGLLLRSTLLNYIKTTDDKRIMAAVVNLLAKWIEICDKESVFFNKSIIDVLKCAIILNKFPVLTDYCYKLNLEIYKNWRYQDCVEFGIDCHNPIIRNEFYNFYDKISYESDLCKRLNKIMCNEFSCNVEHSIAFYIQTLFEKVSKDTKLQGDFPFLNTNKLSDFSEVLVVPDQLNFLKVFPVYNMLTTFDMCSSLAQLCYIDKNLARNMWISVLPRIWSFFNDVQKNVLSSRAIRFLKNCDLNNNCKTVFYEALAKCYPKIEFDPQELVLIGKSYNLWYQIIDELENLCSGTNYNKAIEGMIQMYSLLREEDILEYLFLNTLECKETKKILSVENHGFFEYASQNYLNIICGEEAKRNISSMDVYSKENEFRMVRFTRCLRELNDWDRLAVMVSDSDNFMLNIEYNWKQSNVIPSYSSQLKRYEKKKNDWPVALIWKYHFLLGMFGLNDMKENKTCVEQHIQFSVQDILIKWKELPKYMGFAHIPLLQAAQLITEVKEAHEVQKLWMESSQNVNDVNKLVKVWNNRKPWIGDNLTVWSDLVSWRRTFYSFLLSRNTSSEVQQEVHNIKFAWDQLHLLYGDAALKRNLPKVCKKAIGNIDFYHADTYNWLYKMYLEAKCIEKDAHFNKKLDSVALRPNKSYTDEMKSSFLTVGGSLYDYSGDSNKAFSFFILAFKRTNRIHWQQVIEDNFDFHSQSFLSHTCEKKTPSEHYSTALCSHAITVNAWIQWGILIEDSYPFLHVKNISVAAAALKCYVIASKLCSKTQYDILTARILWILNNDDHCCTLLRTLGRCGSIAISDLWLPQILNIFVEKNETIIKDIILKIECLYPQQVYLALNRMYISEKKYYWPARTRNKRTIGRSNTKKIPIAARKIDKIKLMMNFLQKRNINTIQLDYFVDQMTDLGESWDEELRRKLYQCSYLCYECAFKFKTPNIRVPKEISNFVKTIIISFVAEDVTKKKWSAKNTFSIPDYLSGVYQILKEKFVTDFSSTSVPTIELMLEKLTAWINLLENESNYSSKFVHELRYPKISTMDWSVIRLPNDNYTNDPLRAVRIHNFSSYVSLKDKSGTTVKVVEIRGTDGLIYSYQVSKGTDIESEERIFQLFRAMNAYLSNFKETARKYLLYSIPKSIILTPDLRMIQVNSSTRSLLEIYHEVTHKNGWLNDDINSWFESLKKCVTTDIPKPLDLSLKYVQRKHCPDNVLKSWALMKYPTIEDLWQFRKNFVEHYSLLCVSEQLFSLIKLRPEMLHIDEHGGLVVLFYKFFMNKNCDIIVSNSSMPFRMTPNLQCFISPIRKNQMINCMTATGQCLLNSIDEISIILKLILKDEFMANHNSKNDRRSLITIKNEMMDTVDVNLNIILRKVDKFKYLTMYNPIPDLLVAALKKEKLCLESPTWRPWL